MKSVTLLSRLILSGLLILAFGCGVETQKVRESFENGFASKEIQKLANQELELRGETEKIIARTQRDQNEFTLPVAVIDNGVDVAHPDLVNRFIYKIDGEKIVGVGHDFMGEDEIASSALINPELFAITAAKVNNGLIVLGTRNPFEFLLKQNQLFTIHFMNNFKADPVLQNSLFARIDADSFNIFGLYNIYLSRDKKVYFDPEIYAQKKTDGLLLKASFRTDVIENPALADEWTFREIHSLLDPQYFNQRADGATALFRVLQRIEHGDRMFNLIVESFKSYPFLGELDAATELLVDYRVSRNQSINVDRDAEKESAVSFMSSSLEYELQGINAIDPLLKLKSRLSTMELVHLDLGREKTSYPQFAVNADSAAQAFDRSLETFKEYKNVLGQIKLSATEKYAKKTFDVTQANVEKMNKFILKERAGDFQELGNREFVSDFSSRYRRVHFRTNHPYLSALAESESHGTHVSGIIAQQNPNIRIYPIRITTRSAVVTNNEFARLSDEFKVQFKNWLAEPIVVRSIYSKVPTLRFDFANEPVSTEDRTAYAAKLMESMEEAIDMDFESGSLNFIFFEELEKAIAHVASQKIKVANISLGAEMDQKIPRFSEIDPEKDMVKFFNFLHFENVKFRLGKFLTTEARNTLFVVAAGNSSAWVDGKTRSALPVDLSSRFFEQFEDGQTYIAPNNHIANILGVGSLNPDQDLSSFTNVLLGLKTPMIFAEGEDILSPIKSTDGSSVQQYIMEKIPMIGMPVDVADSRMMDLIKKLPQYKDFAGQDTFADQVSADWYQSFGYHQVLQNTAVFHLAAKYNDHRGRMSGTSMATPAAVGYIADQILKYAQENQIAKTDIYDNENFTPTKLIQRLEASGSPLFPENSVFPFKKINVTGKYSRGDKIQELDLVLKEILK